MVLSFVLLTLCELWMEFKEYPLGSFYVTIRYTFWASLFLFKVNQIQLRSWIFNMSASYPGIRYVFECSWPKTGELV